MNHPRPAGRIKFALPLFLLAGLVSLYAQAGAPNTIAASLSARMDWERMEVSLSLTAPVDSTNVRNRASLLSRKENQVRDFFPNVFPQALLPLRVDSRTVLSDVVKSSPEWNARLDSISEDAQSLPARPAEFLNNVTLPFIFPAFPALSAPFVNFSHPRELDRILDWHPKADYTGLVIYARSEVPIYGTDFSGSLKPALQPAIYDEDMRTVLDLSRMDPQYAAKWGVVAYSSEKDLPLFSDRVGPKPLIVTLRAVYGEVPTDALISRNDAATLLYNDSTRKALAEGRVVVVLDDASLHEDLLLH